MRKLYENSNIDLNNYKSEIASILPSYYTYRKRQGNIIEFITDTNNIDSSIEIIINDSDKDKFRVQLFTKITIFGESTANLKANYLTTTERKIKTKTIKSSDFFDNFDDVKNQIIKHLKAIDKSK